MAEENMGIDQTMAGVPETMGMETSDSLARLEKKEILEGGGSVNFGDEVIQDEIAKILRRNSGAELADIEKNNPSLIEQAIRNLSGEAMGKENMPMMDGDEKRVFMELFDRGVPEDMIIDIMASAKVGATLPATAVNPAEFGGLPNTGSSPAGDPSMPTAGGTGGGAMSNQDMTMYLQNKVNEIKSRTGGNTGMGALSGVPAGNQTPMAMPTPRPAIPPRLGADRTFNPMDQLTPTNTPNT